MTDNQKTKEIRPVNTGTDHRRHKHSVSRDTVLLLVPLVPILVLMILILLVQGTPAIEEEATVTVTETVTEPETTLSEEELQEIAYDEKVRSFTSKYERAGIVLSDGTVNFRSTPDSSTADNKLGQLHDLDVFELLEDRGAWLKIRFNGQEGYVASLYCETGETAKKNVRILLGQEKADSLKNPGIVYTEGNDKKIFSEKHSNDMSIVIGDMSAGDIFEILDEDGDWLEISSGGIFGYTLKDNYAEGENAFKIAKIKSENLVHVLAPVVNLRSEPVFAGDNVVGTVKENEYLVLLDEDPTEANEAGWVKIAGPLGTEEGSAYLNTSGGNAEILFGLKEAQETDAKDLVTEEYDDLLICTTGGYVNIRESTNTKSYKNIIGKIYTGNGAELLDVVKPEDSGDGNKWYRIASGTVIGYVSAGTNDQSFFASGDKAKELATKYAHLTASITTDVLNVRSTPDNTDDSNVWTQVTKGQAYEVLEQKGDWVRIDLGSSGETDNDAYIYKGDSFIRIAYGLDEAIEYSYEEKANAFRQSIVDYACQYIGNPYVWGGTSLTKGCDCSGFVQQIMKKYGISMERSSYYQAKQGVKRTSATMRPGDLIFYADSGGTVNHVVIYIGGGYMVGAQSRRAGIKVYKWNYRTPVAIRDVIGDRVE